MTFFPNPRTRPEQKISWPDKHWLRVLVCGGRDYTDEAMVFGVLDYIHEELNGISCIISGMARGADRLGAKWAHRRGILLLPFPIHKGDWILYGNGAGSVRNQQMIDEGRPDVVVAFPGHNGTDDMMYRAGKHGLHVWEPVKSVWWRI